MELDLDEIKAGMVAVFETSGSFINNRIVKWQEHIGFDPPASNQTHCSICMGGPWLIDGTFPRTKVSNLLEDYQGRKVTILVLEDWISREEKMCRFSLWGAKHMNLDYGWKSLIGFYASSLIPIFGGNPFHAKREPFCSYLIGWAIRRVGCDPWPGVPTALLTPAHIYDAPGFIEAPNVQRE